MAIAGRVAIVPKGDWSAEAEYKRLDEVTYNNTMFIAKKAVPKGMLPTNAEYWSKSIVGSAVTVDAAMSDTSENPVQNKVIKAYVDKKASENVDFSTSTSKLLNDSIEAPMLVTNATRNLLKPTLETTTQNGVTYLKNENGTYSISGKMTDASIASYATIITLTLSKGRYKFIGGISKSKYVRLILKRSSGNENLYDYGDGVVFEANGERLGILLVVNENPSANDIFKPMLTTDLSATYDDFVPYSGYDIKSCGKNLLKYSTLLTPGYSKNQNGVVYTVNNNGSISAKGTATANSYFNLDFDNDTFGIRYRDDDLFVLAASGNNFADIIMTCSHFGEHGTVVTSPVVSVRPNTFTPPLSQQIGNRSRLYLQVNKGKTVDCTVYPMRLRSEYTTIPDYEPYKESTVQITPSTEFPLLGLKSFDGETNIISPGNVEVTFAKSDSGAAIVDALKKSVSDGKTKVANAITDKGVDTATDATFDVMAENISKIDTEAHGATLAVSTSDHELFGKTVTLDMHHTIVGTTVFSNNGTCSFIVQQSGPYTITCGEAHKDVSVTNVDVLVKNTISVNLLLLKIVTFANGTDEEIAKMIQAHYNNKINIADYWAVGDTRSVSLSAMSSAMVGESHRAQTVRFVIAGFEHDTLAKGIGLHSKAAITLLQKDCLMDAANTSNPSANGSNNKENGYMSSRQSNEGGWDACSRRGWCNNIYFDALPTAWRSMVKTVNKKATAGNISSTIKTVQDKIFLPSEIEIFGSTSYSFAGEGAQYQYYKNAKANRYKDPMWTSTYVSSMYFTRSPSNNTTSYCIVNASGNANTRYADTTAGIAPMMCV